MFYDIHSHYMPMVDDGSDSLETTERMLRMALSEGIDHIILTPHYHEPYSLTDYNTIQEGYESVCSLVQEKNIPIQIYLGNEVHVNEKMMYWLENKMVHTMAGSQYVLIEFSLNDSFDKLRKHCLNVVSAGYRPIIAHVERYEATLNQFDHIQELIDIGAYIQVNANTLTGKSGFTAKHFAKGLVKRDLLDFVATDAHNMKSRKPEMEKCSKVLRKLRDIHYMKRILIENPKRVINNIEL